VTNLTLVVNVIEIFSDSGFRRLSLHIVNHTTAKSQILANIGKALKTATKYHFSILY